VDFDAETHEYSRFEERVDSEIHGPHYGSSLTDR
jgi:hypothetical protein